MSSGPELGGKVAIVTGGASGLGRGMVELFVEEGASVVIADVDREGGEALAAQLGAAAVFRHTDVSEASEIQAAVDAAVEQFGGLHVMCNNAGVGGSFKPFLEDDFADFDRVMKVNILGVMVGTQRAARHMKQHGGGAIVNTTSIGGINAGAGVMAYRATKAAVIHLTRSTAIELARHDIRVNCIAPGHIPTGITNYDLGAVIQTMQPLQRHGEPADVADAVLYLASDRSAQITGIVLPIDGGTSAGPPVTQLRDLMRGVKAAKEKAAAREAEGGAR